MPAWMLQMKLAANLSTLFTEVPLLERFALAAAQGFRHVEVQFPYELSIQQIQHQLEQHQLSLCLINVPAGDLMQGGNGLAAIPGQEALFQQAIELAIEYATALKVPRVNLLVGRQPTDVSHADCMQTLMDNLHWACPRLAEQHIQPVIEMINGVNMPNFLIQSMQQGVDLLAQLDLPNLKLQYDCYHMAMMGEDIVSCFKQNIQHIAHIQFADYPGRHEPDSATLPFADFFNTIRHSDYDGFVAAEYLPQQTTLDSLAWQNKYF